MPVEHLWQWLREDVTSHTCYQSPAELIQHVHLFEQDVNSNPFDIIAVAILVQLCISS